MLKIKNVEVVFNKNTIDEKKALDNLNLEVETGDFITIIGSNGAGKSTLFNAIGGLIKINKGSIFLDDLDLSKLKEYDIAKKVRRLFQDPAMGTSPNLSVAENLALAYNPEQKKPFTLAVNKKNSQLFQDKLQYLGLGLEKRLTTKVKFLSGGERQALTLLMSTIVTPQLLLLDEHTAALDPHIQKKVMTLTKKIIDKDNITTLMITHSIQDALKYGNKLIVMNNGKILATFSGKQKQALKLNDVMKLYSVNKLLLSDTELLAAF